MKKPWVAGLIFGMTLGAGCSGPVEITDGKSLAEITLGQSTAADVRDRYGEPDTLKQHGKFSNEMIYASEGLSFFYRQSDAEKSVSSISVTEPFRLETDKGIVLNESTMQDVLKEYGELKWTTSKGSDYWFSEHGSIEYGVLRDQSVPQFPLDKELHLSRKIVRIDLNK